MPASMAHWLNDDDALPVGDAVEFTAALLRAMPVLKDGKGAVQARAKGILLADDRQSVRVRVGDMPVTYTISLMILRDPLNQAEIDLCDEVEAKGKVTKQAKLDTAAASTAALIAGVKRETVELAEARAQASAAKTISETNTLKPVIETLKALADSGLSFAPKA